MSRESPRGRDVTTVRHLQEAATYHRLRWLGVTWMLLRGSSRGLGVRGLGLGGGLGGRGAAVRHGQLTQVGGVGGENRGALSAVQTAFS